MKLKFDKWAKNKNIKYKNQNWILVNERVTFKNKDQNGRRKKKMSPMTNCHLNRYMLYMKIGVEMLPTPSWKLVLHHPKSAKMLHTLVCTLQVSTSFFK
jgi:hypothetical protein